MDVFQGGSMSEHSLHNLLSIWLRLLFGSNIRLIKTGEIKSVSYGIWSCKCRHCKYIIDTEDLLFLIF